MENFEQKYNELVEAARAVVEANPGLSKINKELGRLSKLLPEKENEDERIRKMLVEQMQRWKKCAEDNNVEQDVKDASAAIAYLEKQKEQKPITIVRIPKFRVGDIIQHVPLEQWDSSRKITSIDEHGYNFNLSHLGDTVSGGAIGFAFEGEYELVEQKPAELPKSEDYGIDGLYAAVDILQKTLGKVDGYDTDDGILEHKCAISAVKELVEQKPSEWSEKDENNIQVLLHIINKLRIKDWPNRDGLFDWLKDLPNRFSLQSKQEWSEEDTKIIEDIIHCLEYLQREDTERKYNGDHNFYPKRYTVMIDKLKSFLQ